MSDCCTLLPQKQVFPPRCPSQDAQKDQRKRPWSHTRWQVHVYQPLVVCFVGVSVIFHRGSDVLGLSGVQIPKFAPSDCTAKAHKLTISTLETASQTNPLLILSSLLANQQQSKTGISSKSVPVEKTKTLRRKRSPSATLERIQIIDTAIQVSSVEVNIQ